MAGKKTVAAKKKKRAKTVKSAARSTKSPAKKKAPAKKQATNKSLRKKGTAKKKSAGKSNTIKRTGKTKSLGRPRVTLDARLDLLFHKDYQAREVFDFLRITSVRELEAFAPDEIIKKLAGPLYQTVQRIRKTMALCNRSLANDRDFAHEFKQQLVSGRL
jgi:hypothetical protein